jgi:RNA polymerase sigma-70 factor (ECF subfamily)
MLRIQRAKAGDKSAFAGIVSDYRDMIFTLVVKIVENREDAEDITQEIFIKLYKTIEQFREDSGFSTWLYRIAYNTTLSELRKRKLYFTSIEDHLTPGNEPFDDKSPEEETELKLQYLSKALKSLPASENFILTLHYLDEQSTEAIAKICNLSVANVKVKLHRIRKKLASEIKKMMQHENEQ